MCETYRKMDAIPFWMNFLTKCEVIYFLRDHKNFKDIYARQC
jgi:hypothetical protein